MDGKTAALNTVITTNNSPKKSMVINKNVDIKFSAHDEFESCLKLLDDYHIQLTAFDNSMCSMIYSMYTYISVSFSNKTINSTLTFRTVLLKREKFKSHI